MAVVTTVTRYDKSRPAPSRQLRADLAVIGRCPNGGKLQYASKADARRAGKLMPTSGPRRKAYACPSCRSWHLTSQRQAA